MFKDFRGLAPPPGFVRGENVRGGKSSEGSKRVWSPQTRPGLSRFRGIPNMSSPRKKDGYDWHDIFSLKPYPLPLFFSVEKSAHVSAII